MEIPNNGKQIPTDITEAIKENNISTTQGTTDGTTGDGTGTTVNGTTVLDGTGTTDTGTTVLDGTGTTVLDGTGTTNTDGSGNKIDGSGNIVTVKKPITSFSSKYIDSSGIYQPPEMADFDTSDPFGASVMNYRQGILNSIARWNSKSAATNYTKRLFNSKRITPKDIQETREKRIREALTQVSSIENLGKYQTGSAIMDYGANLTTNISNGVTSVFSRFLPKNTQPIVTGQQPDEALNVGAQNVVTQPVVTAQGGKYRKYKQNYTRRHKKNYTRGHKKNYTRRYKKNYTKRHKK